MNKPSRSYACPGFYQAPFTRRKLLQIGGAGLLGLTSAKLIRADERPAAPRPRARSVIFLFQFGGPSHIDMFDMKPDAPEEIRGPLRPMSTSVPGLSVCEHLPEMARVMDKVTVIRTMTHSMKNHNSASYYALTGHAPPADDIRLRDSIDLYPAYGSVVDHLAPNRGSMPAFVAYPHVLRDGAVTPGQHASFLGKAHDPLLVTEDPNDAGFSLPELNLPAEMSLARLERRRELQKLIDRQTRLLEISAAARGSDRYYDKAISMLTSQQVRQAFDLSAEPAALRDAYGRHTYGQSCLLARRLVEAGVKFVTVYFSNSIGGQSKTSGGWDTHGRNGTRMFPIVQAYHLPQTDQSLPMLITDLDRRGMLDETLIVWIGEFGRTPKINKEASRDHWPGCYTALLAGGGTRRGFAYGRSDANAAYPLEDPVRPDDLAATMYHLLGIDPHTEVYDPANRPLPISTGHPLPALLA